MVESIDAHGGGRRSFRFFVAAVLALFATRFSTARAETWNLATGTGPWSQAANWYAPIGVPASAATTLLHFGGSGSSSYTATNDLAGPFLLNGLTLASTSSATNVIDGSPLRFTGTAPFLRQKRSGSFIINNDIDLDAATTFGGEGSGTITLSGVVGGAGNLTKVGPWAAVFNGANTASGSVFIGGGGVSLGSATSGGGSFTSASDYTIANGATLTLDNTAGIVDRLADAATITSLGGTLQLNGNAAAQIVETAGPIVLSRGTLNLRVSPGAGGATTLSFASLGTPTNGATIDFLATSGTLGASSGGPQIKFTGSTPISGILAGYATVGADFATYGTDGVAPYTGYVTLAASGNLSTSNAQIVSSASSTTISLAGSTTLNSLRLVSGVSTFGTVTAATSGQTLTIGSGGILSTSGGVAATGSIDNIILAGSSTSSPMLLTTGSATPLYFYVESGRLRIETRIQGSNTLVKSGSGELRIQGSSTPQNNYTGATYINEGLLTLSTASGRPTATTYYLNGGVLSMSASSTLGSNTVSRDVFLNAGGLRSGSGDGAFTGLLTVGSTPGTFLTLVTATSTQTMFLGGFNNSLTGGGGNATLSAVGPGTIDLAYASDFSGMWQVNGAVLRASAEQAFGDIANALVVNSGTVRLNSFNATFGSLSGTGGNVENSGSAANVTLTINQTSGTESYAGVIRDAGSGFAGQLALTKQGAGRLILSGTNPYTLGTRISGGTIQFNSSVSLGQTPGAAVADHWILDGGALAVGGSITPDERRGITITSNGGTIEVLPGVTLHIAAVVGGDGGLTKIGPGTLRLSATNPYVGKTVFAEGTLQVASSNSLGLTPATAVADFWTFRGGTLSVTASISPVSTRGITIESAGGSINVASGQNLTLGSIIAGVGQLTKIGPGTLTLNGDNTLLGGIVVNEGTLRSASTDGFGPAPAGVRLNDGTALELYRSTLDVTAGYTFTAAVTTAGSVTLLSNYTATAGTTVGQGVSHSVNSLTVEGGTLNVLPGASVTSGTATFRIREEAKFLSSATINVGQGARLLLDGTVSNNAVVQTFTKIGLGVLDISNSNSGTITGADNVWQLNEGTIEISDIANLGVNTTDVNFNGGTLRFAGNSQNPGAGRRLTFQSGGGTIEIAATRTLNITNNHFSGTGTFTKSGGGELTFTAAAQTNFTGQVVVQEGTLRINGSLGSSAGPLTIKPAGVLSGGGAVNGAVVNEGGAIAPGATGIGKLTVAGTSNAWQDGSRFLFEVFNPAGADAQAGTNWDLLDLGSGSLTIDGTVTIRVDLWNSTGTAHAGSADTHLFDTNEHYKWLFVSAGDLTLSNGANFVVEAGADGAGVFGTNNAFATSPGTFWVSQMNNSLYLEYSAVPEPGSLVLLGVAGVGGAWLRRRRRIAFETRAAPEGFAERGTVRPSA